MLRMKPLLMSPYGPLALECFLKNYTVIIVIKSNLRIFDLQIFQYYFKNKAKIISMHGCFILVGRLRRVFYLLPWWSAGEESACNAGDLGSIPALGRPLEKEMATPCLENSMNRGVRQPIVHGITKSWT